MKKIRMGIFGLGRGASFYSVIKAHGGEVVAICDGNEERIILVSRFDNLGKGASGAAIQNMNIVLGVDEKTGLSV